MRACARTQARTHAHTHTHRLMTGKKSHLSPNLQMLELSEKNFKITMLNMFKDIKEEV